MFETINNEELVTATGGINLNQLPGQGGGLGGIGGPTIGGPTIFNPQGPRPDPFKTDQPVPNPLGSESVLR